MTADAHPQLDYAGGKFGRPSPAFLSKSWRVRHGLFVPADTLGATSTLMGQDAIYVAGLTPGLGVYAGYKYGTFDNWAELTARFGGSALLVSIAPVVEAASPVMCLDIEPGNASPSAAPAFMRLASHDGAERPVFYCSAGDAHLVIAALTTAGFGRGAYALWTAHWLSLSRPHICGPRVCGYPQADATQYWSGTTVDYDIWNAFVLALPAAVPGPAVSLGSRDPVDGANWVRLLQTRLDAWAKVSAPGAPEPAVDGVFGAETALAVRAFQAMEKLTVDGVAGPATWAHVLERPSGPPPPPPAAWHYGAPLNLRVVSAGHTTVKLAWEPPALDGHPPVDHYVVWIYHDGKLIDKYPRIVPGKVLEWEGGGLPGPPDHPGTSCVAHVSASGPGSEHLGDHVFASVGFTTG